VIPPLPSLRELSRELRELHIAWSHPDAGGEYVRLCLTTEADAEHTPYPRVWGVHAATQIDSLCLVRGCAFGWEYVPGSRACKVCDGMALSPGTFATPCSGCDGTGHVPSDFDATAAARRLLAAACDGMVKTEEL
jgi:hypothetical protein